MNLEDYLRGCHERYSQNHHMLGQVWNGPGYHTRVPNGTWAHSTRESLDFALGLLQSNTHVERAHTMIRKVLSLQDTEPISPTYGIWPWLMEEPLAEMAPPDWNWADFCGARLAQMLIDHAALLPTELVQEMSISLGHAAWSIFRRNVGPGYTNIAIMGAGVTLAAGETLEEPRLLDYGQRRLRRLVEHTEHHGGFNEYNSPNYTIVALHECERILQLVRDPTARADTERLRRVAWQTIAEHYHPATEQWAGPHSRTYSDWLYPSTAEYLSEQTGVLIRPHPKAAFHSRGGPSLIRHLPCPADLTDRFRTLPQEVVELKQGFIRRDSKEASTWGTTWLSQHACLGTVNRDSLWVQRRVLLGYWRTEEDPAVVLRLRFLHDGKDFASAYVRNVQQGHRALSVINLLTDKGDFHIHLDRPKDGLFDAEDFRVRYDLSGKGVTGRALGQGRFELAAGPHKAIIHTAPSHFGPYPLEWQLGEEDGKAYLDGLCYAGPRRVFNLEELGEVVIAAGLELLGSDEIPTNLGLEAEKLNESRLKVNWPVSDELVVTAPLHAEPYL